MEAKPGLVMFDGVCNFCNDAVLFIVDRDPRGRFQFTSQQSDVGQQVLRENGLGEDPGTLVLVEDGKVYCHSTAALRIARRMRWPWPAFYALIAVPKPIRDAAYKYFAAHRYQWFGKSETCRIPTPELRRRMLT